MAYRALFLAEDADVLGILGDKASRGVRLRIALGDPDSACVARRGQEEDIGDAMTAKIRNALALYRDNGARGDQTPRVPLSRAWPNCYGFSWGYVETTHAPPPLAAPCSP